MPNVPQIDLTSPSRLIILTQQLPCCAQGDGWGYCDAPAREARIVLESRATGRRWIMVPLCERHVGELVAQVAAENGAK